jgi:D-alanyl-lipoteichoic acid acyltransferase DltB (MBOAT superfamily)
VYIPLGGSKGGLWAKIRNTFIIFLLSGFWHGANWTFIVWGALNATFYLPLLIFGNNRRNMEIVAAGKIIPSIKDFASMVITFTLTVFAWIVFRADNLSQVFQIFNKIFSISIFNIPDFPGISSIKEILILLLLFVSIEWLGREEDFAISRIGKNWKRGFRYSFYYFILLLIMIYGNYNDNQFIYFQF